MLQNRREHNTGTIHPSAPPCCRNSTDPCCAGDKSGKTTYCHSSQTKRAHVRLCVHAVAESFATFVRSSRQTHRQSTHESQNLFIQSPSVNHRRETVGVTCGMGDPVPAHRPRLEFSTQSARVKRPQGNQGGQGIVPNVPPRRRHATSRPPNFFRDGRRCPPPTLARSPLQDQPNFAVREQPAQPSSFSSSRARSGKSLPRITFHNTGGIGC